MFGINALSFALSAAVIAGVRGSYRSSTDEADDEYQGMWSGFAFTFGDGFLRRLCIVWGIMWFAVNIVVVADVPLVGAFGLGATALGLIYAFDSAGGIVGSIAARRVTPRWERVALIADMGAIAFAYSVVSVSPWFALVLIAVAFGLGVDTLAGIVGTTVIQRITPDGVRGRVFAAFGGLGMVANVVAFSVAGLLLNLVGPRGVYAIAAGVAIVAGLVLLPALKMRFWQSVSGGR